ncbi:DUF4189 domain-containing protein [Luteibacter jiangsuensis]|uniref:DUF4189 domain-containing protein n=1 Tax=Luteibacter jiangsuensis TaxID=637577 RepID=UPI003D2F9789
MVKVIQSLLATSALATATAWGQCATGVNTGGGNCVPPDASGMPGYNPGNGQPVGAPEPTPAWVDSWGAIAIDDATGDAGTITDKYSKSEAEQAAMRDCGIRGAKACKVSLTFHNQCAAIAWGSSAWGTASGAKEQQATEDAMRLCQNQTTECKVVYSACSVAHKVR